MGAFRRLGFLSAFVLPALVVTGFYLGGLGNWLSVAFVFIFIPLIDQWVGLDTANVPEAEAEIVGQELYYRLVTYVWVFFQVAFFGWCCYAVASGALKNAIQWLGFTISVGLVTGGIGINVAHELGHKKSKLEQFFSQILLMFVCYMHFFVEHNRGHHVQVATPADPATARKGENFYAFWVRSVFVGYAHAWHLERERLSRKGRSVFSPTNSMIWFTILPIALCALLTLAFSRISANSWIVPAFFFAQSIIAFSFLELVNYVEHYGIVRKQKANGQYERVNPLHSWNASHLISNFLLFQLQRHSDHHANAIKRYQILDHVDESPQLPFSYPTMIVIALVPPLWFKLMNPLLEDWENKVYRHRAIAA